MNSSNAATLADSVNYKIIAGIIAGIVVFHITINFLVEDSDSLVYIFSMITPLVITISSFLLAKRYADTKVYARAYTALAFAFLCLFLAELTYFIYEQFLDLDPYPSIADVFFFLLYPLSIIYLMLNIRFFAPQIHIIEKIVIGLIPVGITLFYVTLAVTAFDELNFDFYYGVAFIISASLMLGFAILGARIFRQSLMGIAWLILVIGLLLSTVGDVWYYFMELAGNYSLTHPVNLFWYAGYWIIVYALYKHKTIL